MKETGAWGQLYSSTSAVSTEARPWKKTKQTQNLTIQRLPSVSTKSSISVVQNWKKQKAFVLWNEVIFLITVKRLE